MTHPRIQPAMHMCFLAWFEIVVPLLSSSGALHQGRIIPCLQPRGPLRAPARVRLCSSPGCCMRLTASLPSRSPVQVAETPRRDLAVPSTPTSTSPCWLPDLRLPCVCARPCRHRSVIAGDSFACCRARRFTCPVLARRRSSAVDY